MNPPDQLQPVLSSHRKGCTIVVHRAVPLGNGSSGSHREEEDAAPWATAHGKRAARSTARNHSIPGDRPGLGGSLENGMLAMGPCDNT